MASTTATDGKGIGNYHGYYKVRADSKSRLLHLDPAWFSGVSCLDVGCNDGQFCMAIAEQFQPSHILGIDPDHVLVDSACSRVKRAVYSAQTKVKEGGTVHAASQPSIPAPKPIKSAAALFMPRSVAIKTAPCKSLPVASATTTRNDIENPTEFPYNVRFKARNLFDISCNLCPSVEGKYDVVTCFSVTKWVQLNGGDDMLVEFLCRLYCLVRKGGRVIIEYQPWKSYENNKGASETTKKMFPGLKIRPEHFELLLSEFVGFEIECRRGTALAEARGFARPIVVLRRPVTVAAAGEKEVRWSGEKDMPALTTAVQRRVAAIEQSDSGKLNSGSDAACSSTECTVTSPVQVGMLCSAASSVHSGAPVSGTSGKRAACEDSARPPSKKSKHR